MESRLAHAAPQSHIRALVRSCLLIAVTQLAGCEPAREEGPVASASNGARGAASPAQSPAPASYALNTQGGSVATFKVDPATGELRRNGFTDAGSIPRSITLSPSGRFAYAANDFTDELSVFSVDASTGVISSVGMSIATGTTPQGVTIDPSGRFAYVPNFGSNDVSAYAIDARTGALTPIGNAVTAGTNPVSIRVDSDGHFAHVTNFNSADTLAYRINPETGALTAVGMNRGTNGSPFSTITGTATSR